MIDLLIHSSIAYDQRIAILVLLNTKKREENNEKGTPIQKPNPKNSKSFHSELCSSEENLLVSKDYGLPPYKPRRKQYVPPHNTTK